MYNHWGCTLIYITDDDCGVSQCGHTSNEARMIKGVYTVEAKESLGPIPADICNATASSAGQDERNRKTKTMMLVVSTNARKHMDTF